MKRFFTVLAASILAGCTSGNFDDISPANGDKGNGNNGNGQGGKTYGISVGGDSQNADPQATQTRTQYDPNAENADYMWSPGDRVGFYMARMGYAPFVDNLPMTGLNETASRYADFGGDMKHEQLMQVNPDWRYDYYSYYPYNAANDGNFPNVRFEIPSTLNLTPDVFPVEYGFMVADRHTTPEGEKPISWLTAPGNEGIQKFGEHFGFKYRHVFAYLEVHLALNLMSLPITKIVVINESGGTMSGTAQINLQTQEVGYVANQSNQITVNIAGGLNISGAAGSTPTYNKIWIPIDPACAGHNFRFEYRTANDDHGSSRADVGGGLQAGKKHRVGLKVPFHVNFYGISSVGSGTSFTYKGLTFGRRNTMVNAYDNSVELDSGAMASDNSTNRGHLRTPVLNLANTAGLSTVPVRMQLYLHGDSDPSEDDRSVQTAAAPPTKNDELDRGNPVKAPYNYYDWAWAQSPYNLTDTMPCILMRANSWGAYEVRIREIWIEPNY